jgi:hypothetical protein
VNLFEEDWSTPVARTTLSPLIRAKGGLNPTTSFDDSVSKERINMENTKKDEKVTITHEVAQVPAEVGTAVVAGVETAGHEVAKVVVEAATVVVDATKTAVAEITNAGEQLGRDAHQAVAPTPKPVLAPTVPTPPAPALPAPLVAPPEVPVIVEPIPAEPIVVAPVAVTTEA